MEVKLKVEFYIDGEVEVEEEFLVANADKKVIIDAFVAGMNSLHGICQKDILDAIEEA